MRWGNLHNIECSCSCSSVTVSPAVVTVFNVVPVCCKDYIICCFVPVIVVKLVAEYEEDSVIIYLHLMIYTPSTLLPSHKPQVFRGQQVENTPIQHSGGSFGGGGIHIRRMRREKRFQKREMNLPPPAPPTIRDLRIYVIVLHLPCDKLVIAVISRAIWYFSFSIFLLHSRYAILHSESISHFSKYMPLVSVLPQIYLGLTHLFRLCLGVMVYFL